MEWGWKDLVWQKMETAIYHNPDNCDCDCRLGIGNVIQDIQTAILL